jgi:hypothetical protein
VTLDRQSMSYFTIDVALNIENYYYDDRVIDSFL